MRKNYDSVNQKQKKLLKNQSKASNIGKRRGDIVGRYFTLFPVIMLMMYPIGPIWLKVLALQIELIPVGVHSFVYLTFCQIWSPLPFAIRIVCIQITFLFMTFYIAKKYKLCLMFLHSIFALLLILKNFTEYFDKFT